MKRLMLNVAAVLVVALLLSTGMTQAQVAGMNKVGALLVYPIVTALPNQETFMTITNASTEDVEAHVSFINGDEADPLYCFECDFNIPLTPNDTETLVLSADISGTGISIESEDGLVSFSCPQELGMVVVTVEDYDDDPGDENEPPQSQDPTSLETQSDNIFFGEEVVVDYANGFAYSIPALSFEGDSNDGDRAYEFGDEYASFPRYVAADFIAPDLTGDKVIAELALFTLNFDRQHPPLTDCSVIGYDAEENPFSRSFLFGCWTLVDLIDISPEFAYPNLGQGINQRDTHGWLALNCRVDRDGFQPLFNENEDADGAVHGAIVQIAEDGSVIRRETDHPRPVGPEMSGTAAWARLLYQSMSKSDDFTLTIEEPNNGDDFVWE